MMRRFTSAPKPAAARAAVHLDHACRPAARAAARSARRRSGPGWPTPRPARSGSRRAARRSACGSSTSPTLAPRRRHALESTPRTTRARRARRPAPAGRRARRRVTPAQVVRLGQRDRLAAAATEVESRGSWPAIACSARAASRTVQRERADLIERRRERDQAVARDAAVGRLHADDAAERGGLADRAAGVGAQRQRREPAATAAAEPPLRSAGHARACPTGCGSAPNAEFSVDEPMANSSMLVLPSETRPGRSGRVDDVRRRTSGR